MADAWQPGRLPHYGTSDELRPGRAPVLLAACFQPMVLPASKQRLTNRTLEAQTMQQIT